MSASDEEAIITAFCDNTLQKKKLFEMWRKKFGKRATYRALITAIFASNNVDLAYNVCQMLRESKVTNNLSTTLVSYRNKLMHGYVHPVMEEEWPQPLSPKYIDLTIVQKHSSIDMEEVELEQLFSLNSGQGKVILIEGAPGSGKSTLLWHICQKWKSGELFQQFSLVLLVLLRDVHNAQCLTDILPCIPCRSAKYTSEYRKKIVSEIEDIRGNQVLILLDGWDEASADMRKKGSLIHHIITNPSKCNIEAATVVVSSAPTASHEIRNYDVVLEIRGFTEKHREEYVRESLQNNPEAAHSLLQQIQSIPQLGQKCHLPLYLVIITHIFKYSNNTLPSTYCQIIIQLTLSCLQRHIQKSMLHTTAVQPLETFNDLPDDLRKNFLKLCGIAYEGVTMDKCSFTVKDMRELTRLPSMGMPQITTL